MIVQLVRLEAELPEGFAALRAEADAEGHSNLGRLEAELAQAPELFTVLLAAFVDGDLVGIGGVTPEPADPTRQRLRRLYVRPAARRTGVARTLVGALMQEALQHASVLTVHAGNPGAERFWEAMGFAPVVGRAWSHEFRA